MIQCNALLNVNNGNVNNDNVNNDNYSQGFETVNESSRTQNT